MCHTSIRFRVIISSTRILTDTVLCKGNANTCRRNSKKFLVSEFLTETKRRRHFREFSRHVLFWTARTFGDIFLDGFNATQGFWVKIRSMWRIFEAKIRCYCSFFSKRFGWICGLVLLYLKFPWNFPLWFESPRDLCCLQPWQHSVYQLCWCVWDHLRTLLLVVIVAKVSNYSTKKSRSSTSKASTQLKYWKY